MVVSIFIVTNIVILRRVVVYSSSGDHIFIQERRVLPNACSKFEIKPGSFPSIHDIAYEEYRREQKSDNPDFGGHWNACTHLMIYGINFPLHLARQIAHGFKPSSVLEFGCGLGTLSDFLARFTTGGSDVVCVEPNVMPKEVFDVPRNQGRARQLAVNIFDKTTGGDKCADALRQDSRRDLVITLEVAEHVDNKHTGNMVKFLADMTGKFLIFSAARPDQGGTGHINTRTTRQWQKLFREEGLVYDKLLSKGTARTAYPVRGYDLFSNLMVFHRGQLTDTERAEIMRPLRDIAGNERFFPSKRYVGTGEKNEPHKLKNGFYGLWRPELSWGCEFNSPGDDPNAARINGTRMHGNRGMAMPCIGHALTMARGHEMALWPELDLMKRKVRMYQMCVPNKDPSRHLPNDLKI